VHPDFTLPGIVDGEPVSLSQFRGRKVLLVHFASW
jgi:peroxiredoxin